MDRTGNCRHGVELPYNYWRRRQWMDAFKTIGIEVADWRPRLGLYWWPASLLFERSLHFAARLAVPQRQPHTAIAPTQAVSEDRR